MIPADIICWLSALGATRVGPSSKPDDPVDCCSSGSGSCFGCCSCSGGGGGGGSGGGCGCSGGRSRAKSIRIIAAVGSSLSKARSTACSVPPSRSATSVSMEIEGGLRRPIDRPARFGLCRKCRTVDNVLWYSFSAICSCLALVSSAVILATSYFIRSSSSSRSNRLR